MPKVMVTVPSMKTQVEFTLDLGDNLQDMVEKYGELVVYRLAYEKAKTSAMNIARNLLSRGKTPEEVVKYLAENWSPIRRTRSLCPDVLENLASDIDLSDL